MKKYFFSFLSISILLPSYSQADWIRVNQIGYLADDVKVGYVV